MLMGITAGSSGTLHEQSQQILFTGVFCFQQLLHVISDSFLLLTHGSTFLLHEYLQVLARLKTAAASSASWWRSHHPTDQPCTGRLSATCVPKVILLTNLLSVCSWTLWLWSWAGTKHHESQSGMEEISAEIKSRWPQIKLKYHQLSPLALVLS